ncbi:MAG: hypothetical protein KIPDCIKN_03912 [Haliscomenobacter sp.]|nr:hypothetical protein [Haliscomenobacter sp.]
MAFRGLFALLQKQNGLTIIATNSIFSLLGCFCAHYRAFSFSWRPDLPGFENLEGLVPKMPSSVVFVESLQAIIQNWG